MPQNSLYTPELGDRLLQLLRTSASLRSIAADVGIGESTFRVWRSASAESGAPRELVAFAERAHRARPYVRAGRKSVFSDEIAQQAVELVRRGMGIYAASEELGLSRSLLATWMWLGRHPGAPEHLRQFAQQMEISRTRWAHGSVQPQSRLLLSGD